jgi:hypothetical protein
MNLRQLAEQFGVTHEDQDFMKIMRELTKKRFFVIKPTQGIEAGKSYGAVA